MENGESNDRKNLIDRLHKNGLFFRVVGDIYGTKRYIYCRSETQSEWITKNI